MTRYIDADALKNSIDEHVYLVHHGFNETEYGCTQYGIHQIIDDAPTIDAVPKEKILLFLNIANEELSKAHANKSANGIVTWSASVTTLEGLLK